MAYYGNYFDEWVKVENGHIYYEDGYVEIEHNEIKVKNIRRAKWVSAYGSPNYINAIKDLKCSIPKCYKQQIDSAHTVSKSIGGTWRDIVPLCRWHHTEQHKIGFDTFCKKYDVDLIIVASIISDRLSNLVKI